MKEKQHFVVVVVGEMHLWNRTLLLQSIRISRSTTGADCHWRPFFCFFPSDDDELDWKDGRERESKKYNFKSVWVCLCPGDTFRWYELMLNGFIYLRDHFLKILLLEWWCWWWSAAADWTGCLQKLLLLKSVKALTRDNWSFTKKDEMWWGV